VIGIVDAPLFAALVLLLFVSLVIVLRCGDGKST
jgi:hypothetical protein